MAPSGGTSCWCTEAGEVNHKSSYASPLANAAIIVLKGESQCEVVLHPGSGLGLLGSLGSLGSGL